MSMSYIPYPENRQRFLAYNPLTLAKYRRLSLGSGQLGGKAKGLLYAQEMLLTSEARQVAHISIPESRFLATDLFLEFVQERQPQTFWILS